MPTNYNNMFTNVVTCYCDPNKTNIAMNNVIWFRNDMMCGNITEPNSKVLSLTQPPGYLGTSKKMAYGKFCRTTPGLTTFANKKVQDKIVQPATFVQQPACTSLGKRRDARQSACRLTSIHPRVAQKIQCVNNQTCRVSDFTERAHSLQLAFENNLPPFKKYH